MRYDNPPVLSGNTLNNSRYRAIDCSVKVVLCQTADHSSLERALLWNVSRLYFAIALE